MNTRYQILIPKGVFDFNTRTNIMPYEAGWDTYQDWLTAGGTPLPPDSVGPEDLETSKGNRCAEIDAYAAGLRNKAVAGRSAGEMASWTAKSIEANHFLATGDEAEAPLLVAIAAIRGISVHALALKVVAQAKPMLMLEAQIDGIRGRHCDTVYSFTDVRDIITYNWHTDWPTL